MKVYEALNKDNWCKGNYAKTKLGISVLPDNPEAVTWCLLGMIRKIYLKLDAGDTYCNVFDKAIAALPPGATSLTRFNDDPKTTIDMVLDVAKKADI